MHRPSLRAALTTVAAAVVLVGGADLASYAATGDPLVLGHSNTAGGTTSLRNSGRGPALSLNNIRSAPPLVVNSSKMVKNLNANKVGGKTAAQLSGATQFKFGSVNQTFPAGTTLLFNATIPTGTYQIGMTGLVTESGSGTGDTIECLALDKNALEAAIGGGTLDYTKVYALSGNTEGDFDYGVINYSNPAQKISNSHLVIGCAFNSTAGTFTAVHQIAFVFKPVTAVSKSHGSAIPLPKRATGSLIGRLH